MAAKAAHCLGEKRGEITDDTLRQKQFDKINWEHDQPELVARKNLQTGLLRYKKQLPNIRIHSGALTWNGGHRQGGVGLSLSMWTNRTKRPSQEQQQKYADRIAHVVLLELGLESHSLLVSKFNNKKKVQNELKQIENFLYPGLREAIQNGIAGNANVYTEFYNYVLSPEELVAEFNSYRATNPEEYNAIAPEISKLLESVENDPKLVRVVNSLPDGFVSKTQSVGRLKNVEDPNPMNWLELLPINEQFIHSPAGRSPSRHCFYARWGK